MFSASSNITTNNFNQYISNLAASNSWDYTLYDSTTKYKQFKIGNLTFNVCNINNKFIQVNELLTTIRTQSTGVNMEFAVGSYITFTSLDDAKNYINRIKKFYKKMQVLEKKLDLDTDFT